MRLGKCDTRPRRITVSRVRLLVDATLAYDWRRSADTRSASVMSALLVIGPSTDHHPAGKDISGHQSARKAT
jgi:hypothetical protein